MGIVVVVDTLVHSAYIKLSDEPVARTVAFNDEINIDVDELGVAVGIEALEEDAPLPLAELTERFHVHSDVVDMLRLVRPDVSSFVAMTQANEGGSRTSDPQLLADA